MLFNIGECRTYVRMDSLRVDNCCWSASSCLASPEPSSPEPSSLSNSLNKSFSWGSASPSTTTISICTLSYWVTLYCVKLSELHCTIPHVTQFLTSRDSSHRTVPHGNYLWTHVRVSDQYNQRVSGRVFPSRAQHFCKSSHVRDSNSK